MIKLLFFTIGMSFILDSGYYLEEGVGEYNKGNYYEAYIQFNNAIKIEDNNFIAFFNEGTALYKLHRYSEANISFEKALKLSTTKFQKNLVLYNLANTLLKINNLERAIKLYREVLRNYPNHFEAKYNLSWALLNKSKNSNSGQSESDNQSISTINLQEIEEENILEAVNKKEEELRKRMNLNKKKKVLNEKEW